MALTAVGLAAGAVAPAAAGEPDAVSTAELVSGQPVIRSGQPFWMAVHLDLAEGWHTYWRNPGDSGVQAMIKWRLPPGVTADEAVWPYPSVFEEGPIVTYGYEDQAWLFTRLNPDAAGAGSTLTVGAEVQWLVCREICIPQRADLTLALPVAAEDGAGPATSGASSASPEPPSPSFADALARVPVPMEGEASYQADGDVLVLTVSAPDLSPGAQAYFFPHDYGVIDHSAPQASTLNGGSIQVSAHRDLTAGALPETVSGVLVVRDGERVHAYEIRAAAAAEEHQG